MAKATGPLPRPPGGHGGLAADAVLAVALAVVLSVGTFFAARYHQGYRPPMPGDHSCTWLARAGLPNRNPGLVCLRRN
jgi:hypothetical protein